jgi:hypothetical protein
VAVALLFDRIPYGVDDYEAIRRQIGAVAREPPQGAVFHMAGPGPDGWRVIEVWESLEDAERFERLQLAPVLAALGLPPRPAPQVWDVHRLRFIASPPA